MVLWYGDGPELHLDLDRPMLEVLILVYSDFAGTLDRGEVLRESVADFLDEGVELGLPLLADIGNLNLKLVQRSAEFVELARFELDGLGALLKLLQRTLVAAADQTVESCRQRDHLGIELIDIPLLKLVPDVTLVGRKSRRELIALRLQALPSSQQLLLATLQLRPLLSPLVEELFLMGVLRSELLEVGLSLNL